MTDYGRLHQIDQGRDTVLFDEDAIENVITGHGVTMVHFKSLRSPIGMVDLGDIRKPDADHSGNSNGFLYKRAGTAEVTFTGNSRKGQPKEIGFVDDSTVQVTLPHFYEDDPSKLIRAAQFDRFYLADPDIVVSYWHLFKASATGIDKLKFPVEDVEWLIDSRGDEYALNQDFVLDGGLVRWIGARRPLPESVCSVRFLHKPYWYLQRFVHEIRAVVKINAEGEKEIHMAPQAVVLQREYIFEDQAHDPQSKMPNNPRQVPPPPPKGLSSLLGPR